MKRTAMILTFALLLSLLSGCAGQEADIGNQPAGTAAPAETQQEAVISPSPEETAEGEPSGPASYEDVLDLYYAALSGRWDTNAVNSRGLSVLCTYCYEGEPLENVGYVLLDLDGDGSDELLIGGILDTGRFAGMDFSMPSIVFDIYTIANGRVVNVAQSFERSRRHLLPDGRIYGEGSSGAANDTYAIWQMRGAEFVMTEALVSDGVATFDEETWYTELNWFMLKDGNWDTETAERLTQAQAEKQIAAYEEQVIQPDYIPLSRYTPRTIPTPAEWTQIPGSYRYLLDSYYLAASDEWDSEQLIINNLNTLCQNGYDGEAVENIGWLLRDLDGDGVEELLLGFIGGENFTDRLLLDLYTLTTGQFPESQAVFQSWERERFFLLSDGRFYLVNSPDVSYNAGTVYTFSNGALVFSEGVACVTDENGVDEYYRLDETGQRVERLTAGEGEAYFAEWRDMRVEPEFKPLSAYWRMTNEDR